MPIHEPTDPAPVSGSCTPPERAASELRAGAILPGTNGSLWIAARRADSANAENAAESDGAAQGDHWALYSTPSHAEVLYWAHDNGGRPFMVRVTPFVFAVYTKDKDIERGAEEHICAPDFDLRKGLTNAYDHPSLHTKLVAGSTPYLKLWAAEDTKLPQDFALGNSLLVQLSNRSHMSIGNVIHTFDLAEGEVVQDYQSPVGNNDIPYPYIVTNVATYLTIEGFASIPNSVRDAAIEDPYKQFYAYPHPRGAANADPTQPPQQPWPHPKLAPTTVVCKRPW